MDFVVVVDSVEEQIRTCADLRYDEFHDDDEIHEVHDDFRLRYHDPSTATAGRPPGYAQIAHWQSARTCNPVRLIHMGDDNGKLPADIRQLVSGGVIDTTRANAAGVSRDRLFRLVKAGLLTRLAEGSYALSSAVTGLDEWGRFELRARAFALAHSTAFLTGWAATVTWGLPTLGNPPPSLRPCGR